MGGRPAVVVASLWLVGCGGATAVTPEEVTVTPDRMQFCCDPDAVAAGTEVGTITVSNANPGAAVPVVVAGESYVVPPGESIEIPIVVTACGEQTVSVEVDSNPPTTFPILIDEACPTVVTDPVDDAIGDPSLDLIECAAAHAPDDLAWIRCEMAGDWRPDDALYSWFVTFQINEANGTAARCTIERHDGVALDDCDVGVIEEVRDLDGGPVMVIPLVPAAAVSFQVTAGVSVAGENPTLDTLTGTFGSDQVDIPAE